MTDDETKLAKYRADPERYTIASNGAVWDREAGRFADMIPSLNPYSITKANAADFHQFKKQKAQMGLLRGLALAAGVNLDEATLEQIASGAGTAVENMTRHFYQTFMKSSNVRGMAEAFRGMTAPLLGETEQPKPASRDDPEILDALNELINALRAEIVEGKVIS